MTVITGGIVRYERTVKTGDFENKKLAVELSFGIEDGADEVAALDQVGNQAIDFVHNKLGLPTGTPAARRAPKASATAITETAASDAQKAASAASRKPAKPPSTPKTEDVVDMGEGTGQAISSGGERTNPADDLSFLDEPEAAPEITDKEIVDKIGQVNGKINNPIEIKKLVGKFAGQPPKTYRDIPQDKRATFLKELLAL